MILLYHMVLFELVSNIREYKIIRAKNIGFDVENFGLMPEFVIQYASALLFLNI
jgi:hypothetical protein